MDFFHENGTMRDYPIHFHRIILSLIALSGSLYARAQETANDTLPVIGLPEVVVSALRMPLVESNVPYSLSLLKARNNIQGLSLSESIAGLPGLEVNARYNYAVGDRITNRGFGARTQFGVRGIRIVSDDMPVTFADGQSNLDMIDIQDLSYAELLRGPGSSLYGNAAGGVLILHTKKIADEHLMASIFSTAGSNGLFHWNTQIQGRTGKTKLSLQYSDFAYSGFREHSSASHVRVILKMSSVLSPVDHLDVQAGYVAFNALNPGSLTIQEYGATPHNANPSSISNAAGQDGNQEQFSTSWKHYADTASLFKLTVYAILRSVVNPIIGKIVVLPQYSGGTTASYNSSFRLGKRSVAWTAGTEVALRFNNRENFQNDAGQEGALTIHQREQVVGAGIFAQALYAVTAKLNLDACLRYDLDYFGVQNLMTPLPGVNSSGGRNMRAFDPSFGALYHLSRELNIYVDLSTSFETPTSTELVNRPGGAGGFNPDLDPAKAIEYEAGLKGSIGQWMRYDLAAYIIHTRDELIPFQVPATPGQDYYRNAGSTGRRGTEITLTLLPLSYLDISSTLSTIDAAYKNFTVDGRDYAGNKIPGISRLHEVTELKLHTGKGLYCSVFMQEFGRMFVDDSNSAYTGQYTLFDLGIGHEGLRFGKKQAGRIILSAGISNLFERHYITAVTVNAAASRYYEPGPGRTFYLNARVDLARH